MYLSGFSKETGPIVRVCVYERIYYEELAPVIMQTEESRPRIDGIVLVQVQRHENQESQ